ncbi:angiogenic factor with G patch and FHA domains 1 isoform X2 [Leguminivora glycinivorella]|uniref:angiogenic factor with G patch and FHA domains 1 isoform X2 n=1 Tax=Leguminivora glycinivorella TaxID=1035111 RepID=UPI00200C3FDB|nr:angiogenic factor with G patch and FHA domains 1 isoform X2 [Leguminivora glycinivorella]
MEINNLNNEAKPTIRKSSFNLRRLRLSLKFRPEILKLVLKMRQKIRKKARLIKEMKKQLESQTHSTATKINSSTQTENYNNQDLVEINKSDCKQIDKIKHHNASTQTDNLQTDKLEPKTNENQNEKDNESVTESSNVTVKNSGWSLNSEENEKSIADQVKEVAQSAMQQSGMVFVESAGMYYDYKTGYYYSADLGLYYHPDTGCYYRYSEDKQTFEFHSYPDRSKTATNPEYEAHEKRKARKLKKGNEEESKAKRRKKNKKVENGDNDTKESENKANADKSENAIDKDIKIIKSPEKGDIFDDADMKEDTETVEPQDLEEGECSDSEDEAEDKKKVEEEVESDDSDASVSTFSNDDDSIAKHHPPSMRVIVRETNLPKLKVGTLFLVTKDGGTVGREGSSHCILIEDYNVSRNHLDIKYDTSRRTYTVTDLGSKNGTTLNGVRISESQIISEPVEVMHGSTLQLGETKLLCHIHPGIDTCGHCEPGLVMETQEKEKKAAYTRTCSVQKQHQLELARLKNKYAPKPLAIEETAYNDRAKERRDKVGSSHHSEKTQSADLDTFIAPENKGFKLLQKMGWSKGEGLGKDSQGDTEPIPLVGNDGTSGLGTGAASAPSLVPKFAPKNLLGTSTMRLAAKTKMLQPPAKAFQDPEDDDSGDE